MLHNHVSHMAPIVYGAYGSHGTARRALLGAMRALVRQRAARMCITARARYQSVTCDYLQRMRRNFVAKNSDFPGGMCYNAWPGLFTHKVEMWPVAQSHCMLTNPQRHSPGISPISGYMHLISHSRPSWAHSEAVYGHIEKFHPLILRSQPKLPGNCLAMSAPTLTFRQFHATHCAIVGHMSEERTVFNTSLEDTPEEYWANTILMRLLVAMGSVEPGFEGHVEVDADAVLLEAEHRLRLLNMVALASGVAILDDEEDDDGPE